MTEEIKMEADCINACIEQLKLSKPVVGFISLPKNDFVKFRMRNKNKNVVRNMIQSKASKRAKQ